MTDIAGFYTILVAALVTAVPASLVYLARRFQRSKDSRKSAVSTAPIKASHAQLRTHLLEQLQASWLDGLLENSLYHTTCQQLGLKPQAERPWNITLQWPNLPAQTLPPATSLLDPFSDLGGSLLILGEPGSGKTTTLLELARDLHQIALHDDHQPIPLLFNLASWTVERPHLFNWLTDQLHLTYGIEPSSGYDWLEHAPYHLLLDGLDQIPTQHHPEFLEALDQFRQDSGPVNIVLTSTTADYTPLTQRPPFKGALVIQPLDDPYIDRFLTAANPHLAQSLPDDPALPQLAQNPLTLNLLALTYPDTLPDATTPITRQNLLARFVSRMLAQNGGPKTAEKSQSLHHLSWLAARLRERHQPLFYIEALQPDWLGPFHRLYILSSTFLFGLGFFLLFWLLFGLTLGVDGGFANGLTDGLFPALVFGLIGALIGAFSRIKPANIFQVNWKWWLGGFAFGLLSGGYVRYAAGEPLFPSLIIGISFGLIYGLIGGLKGKTTHLKSTPNQPITLPLRYSPFALLFFSLSCSLSALGTGFALPRTTAEINNPLIIIALALIGLVVGGLFGWLRFGGSAYLKHTLLRRLLVHSGFLPKDLIPFLDEMTDRHLLRKIGSAYTFTHPLLRDYLADLESDSQ